MIQQGKCWTLGLLMAAVAAGWLQAAERPRNLLIITADDMNWDATGWMGNQLGATPRLDDFAKTCHRFVNNHLTAPICQPSREALMTGLVPHRNGGLGFNPIKPGTPTLVSLLKARGYFAGVIDKHPHMKPDAEFPWDVALSQSGKSPPLFRQHMNELLQAAASAGKPFFINANITDPHRPWPSLDGENAAGVPATPAKAKKAAKARRGGGISDNLARIYKPDEVVVPPFLEDLPAVRHELAQYYTAVARLDVTFQGILDALRAAGHADDTVIVFMSDNGISLPFAKATVYRNGTHSPVLLRWPGMGQPETRDEFVSSVDILPTVLELLAVAPPDSVDGRSWLPLLRGESQPDRDYAITHVNTVSSGKSFAQRCVRTKDWALMFHAWPDGTPKFRVEAMSGLSFNALAEAAKSDARIAARVNQLLVGAPLGLYDQRADPGERVNLISEEKNRPEVERLAKLLLTHMERTGDPQTESFRQALEKWRSGN